MSKHPFSSSVLVLTTACFTLALAACGRSPSESTPASAAPSAATTAADAAQAEADRAAELAAKEKDLADREATLKQKEIEAELARRDAENAAAAAAQATADAQRARTAAAVAQKKAAAKAATATAATAVKPAAPPAPPTPIVVPAGTQLAIELTSAVNTKTAKVGDHVQGRLQSEVMIGDQRAASAGAPVQGTVTQVVSGSKKIGGIPTLGLTFDSLVVANGATVPITAQLLQQGKSETGRDTAKILGGAAAGAVIGHQVNNDKGTVIGGILGAAAGTAAAKNTGGEVNLPAGTVVTVTTGSAFQVDR